MTAATLTDGLYARGLARAFGGALIFAFPLLMTMEMWSLGFTITPLRLLVFLGLSLPLLFGLSYYAGVNRRPKGTPYRRAIGTPFWCSGWTSRAHRLRGLGRREGVARLEAQPSLGV
ncbi:DUF2391 family protein, partial [Brevundimonas sp. TWP2-3-4b1]|uniref:DUF2391 family protein n=1 Tax=Brevundimonas sp. TWP2-3-4b1 TaxID=2804580 RepID=UPI003CEEA9C5